MFRITDWKKFFYEATEMDMRIEVIPPRISLFSLGVQFQLV